MSTTTYDTKLNTAADGSQTTVYTPSSSTTPVITPAGLGAGASAAVVPVATTPTGSTALGGMIDSTQDSYLKGLADRTKTTESNSGDALTALLDELRGSKGKSQLTDENYRNGGVDTAASDLNDVTTQIAGEKQGLANTIAQLKLNKEGKFGGAVDQDISAATDASIARQANLAVIQSAATGKYNLAKSIADRAVDAKYEQEQTNLGVLQKVYDSNKDLFTTAQQQQFTAAQATRAAALEDKRTEQKNITDLAITALKNGAPVSVAQKIQGAKTLTEAEGAAGSYIVTPKTGSGKAATFGDVVSSINAYLQPGQFVPGTTIPIIQPGTPYLTKAGFQAIVDYGGQNNVKRGDIIAQYAPYLDPGGYANYGLTGADAAALTNTSKTTVTP